MTTDETCPRCGGAVIDYRCQAVDTALCITCGWRRRDVPPGVQQEVEAHLGKSYVENRYMHSRLGKGKPPLSGWEREKLRRAKKKRDSPETTD